MVIWFACWFMGGVHLDYLKAEAPTKAQEICDEDSKIVYEGYERTVFNKFGGEVWYLCYVDKTPVSFNISRRIDTKELQVYGYYPVLLVPTTFNLNQ